MRVLVILVSLLAATSGHTQEATWKDAREVAWADHSDWRISGWSATKSGDWEELAQLVCVHDAYDLLLMEIDVEPDGVGHRTGLEAWFRGDTYTIPHPTVAEARYRVDDGEWRPVMYPKYYGDFKDGRLISNGHVAFPFSGTAIERFKAGTKAEFVVRFSNSVTKRTTISLLGFTKAFETLPNVVNCR